MEVILHLKWMCVLHFDLAMYPLLLDKNYHNETYE